MGVRGRIVSLTVLLRVFPGRVIVMLVGVAFLLRQALRLTIAIVFAIVSAMVHAGVQPTAVSEGAGVVIPDHKCADTADEPCGDTGHGKPRGRLAAPRVLAVVAKEDFDHKPEQGQQPGDHQQRAECVTDHRNSKQRSNSVSTRQNRAV